MTSRYKAWKYGTMIVFVTALLCIFKYDYNFHGLNSEVNLKSKDLNTLIDDLKQNYIYPPSKLPYKLSHPDIENPSHGQTQFVDNYFKNMTNGFFIESGAYDGEELSNTLFLERFRNWTGLLVEPNPSLFISLIDKQRKAYAINSCLSTKNYSSVETFNIGRKATFGHVVQEDYKNNDKSLYNFIRVNCFPLFSILQALNRFEIDYFSLDVEGAEKGILETLPWDKLNIITISIEHNKWPGGRQSLLEFMERVGYTKLTEIKNVGVAPDFIFQKNTNNSKRSK